MDVASPSYSLTFTQIATYRNCYIICVFYNNITRDGKIHNFLYATKLLHLTIKPLK